MVDEKFTKYATDVISGNITAGKYIKLACERYMKWFELDDRYFDEEAAERPIKFISHLKHVTGDFAFKPFLMLDWQCFLMYALFGWKWKKNGKRVIRNCYLQVARKAGKTSLISAIGLYCLLADGEAGSEVDICAPCRQQSSICYKDACDYAEGINRGNMLKILRNGIYHPKSKSKLTIMSSDAKYGDGFNTHLGILDEYAAFSNNDISDLITGSMGMRSQPLMIYITTAGFNLFGPCKQYRDMCVNILEGEKFDDTIFPLIYELDEGDDWEDQRNWIKAQPSLGVTLTYDKMYDYVRMANNSPSAKNSILTKNFNVWCSSKSQWLSYDDITNVSKSFELEDFAGRYCCLSVDLACVSDLTCLTAIIPTDDKIYFKTWSFVSEKGLRESPNAFNYNKWVKQGYLEVIPGNVMDYDYLVEKMDEINAICPVQDVYYDKFNATQWAVNCTNKGYNMFPFSQALGSFNTGTKEFERLCLSDKIVIDDNDLVKWSFTNVTLKTDYNENVKPTKESKDQKIDPVISMVQGLGGLMINQPGSSEIFVIT